VEMRRIKIGIFLCLVVICCKPKEKKEEKSEFIPPEDNKITMEKAKLYVKASYYLMEAIKKHEKNMKGFAKRYNLSEELTELVDSIFKKEHPEIIETWERLQNRWKEYESEAYRKAGISEEEFNWIGGVLTDSINKEIQKWVENELKKTEKKEEKSN
jgi:hypothetical protein